MEVTYGNVTCNEIKTNNWKRMHGIPLKTKAKTLYGGEIIQFSKNMYQKGVEKSRKKLIFEAVLILLLKESTTPL